MLRELIQRVGRGRMAILIAIIVAIGGGLAVLIGNNISGNGRVDDDGVVDTGPGIRVETELAASTTSGDDESRLRIRLSKGQEQPSIEDGPPLVTGDPLSAEEIQRILDRLSPMDASDDDAEDFRLPPTSLPPPRAGETISEIFPPPSAPSLPEIAPSGPLELLRFAPEGEIPLAPFLSVTFNQPMVPLASIEALSAEAVPVKVTPELPGVWKWLGTRTLSFEYSSEEIDRFPMATEYLAEVPAGTQSAIGGTLEQSVSWRFSTPPPQLESTYPQDGPQPLEPLIFMAFDQRIDPAAVLRTISVEAGGQSYPLRLATSEEIEKDETVSRLAGYASEGRWLAFRSEQAFPGDTFVAVTLGPGTPSAEGPLVTQESQNFEFFTYAPLKIVRHRCSWYEDDCPPLTPLNIEFNNPLDQEAFDESWLQIDPELPGATASIFGNSISIQGPTKGRTTYQVSLDAALKDIFGQTLGEEARLSFRVGSAPRSLVGPDQIFVTLDPSSEKPLFTVYSINHSRLRVRAYAVTPADWPAFKAYMRDFFYDEEKNPTPPGREVMNETISIDAVDDTLTETAIDLSDALDGDYGHLIVVVDPPSGLLSQSRDRQQQTVQAWVQVTRIGLDVFIDHSEMVVWASDLQDGSPLAGVRIDLAANTSQATTGADGTARFPLRDSSASPLIALLDEDTAILPSSPSYWWEDEPWPTWGGQDELRWYVFDDRQMYRPGEEVHIKGWIRRIGGKQGGDVGLVDSQFNTISYRVFGPQGNEFLAGTARANALGGFDFSFTLPENANLGSANLMLEAPPGLGLNGSQQYHFFQIQEFRRPEFEVTARNETPGPFFVGEHAVVAVSANYFAGGPLPNADVTWNVTSSPASYSPPNWPGFVFGTWTPWWFYYRPFYAETEYDYYGIEYGDEEVETFTGVTDASGNHYLRIDFDEAGEATPYTIIAESTVMDINRQAWAASTSLLLHPAELYVGMRSERTFVQRGTPLEIEVILTDIDGNPVPGRPLQVTAARLEWRYRKGSWLEEEVDSQACNPESRTEPVTCTFETAQGGTYRITATATDDQGRKNQSQFTRWVSGGQRPPARSVEQETVTLIPDKESYQPGEVAEILVQAPFSPAEGLLTVSRNGFLYTERFRMAEDSYTLRVPIAEAHIPNLNIQVDLNGAAPRTSDAGEVLADIPPRPAYATGSLSLSIPAINRTLTLQVAPRQAKLEPGGETAVDVMVTDAQGQPVAGAELAVVVVDEAILALTNYQLNDPIAIFYTERPSDVSSYYGRSSIVLANPELLGEQVANLAQAVERAVMEEVVVEAEMAAMAPAPAEGAAFDDSAAAPSPIRVRTNFDPLAAFVPEATTDSQGQAHIEIELPDNLTRYRIMVVAVAGGKQFGSGESNLTARLPLMVRPSAPRFLNFGDAFELPVVLQNQTDLSMEVEVVAQAANIVFDRPTAGLQTAIAIAGQRVTVPANDRVEVRFPAATISPGTARFQIAAVSGSYADAATVELPVYTPATTEAFATYGVVDEGVVAQPVAAPNDVFPQFGGLEISTSSTALQSLTDAMLYLVSYRYECTEQIASRILAVAALRDVLTAFSAAGLPSTAEIEQAVQRDIDRLQGLQNSDGSFPIWERNRKSVPFYGIHAAHALQRAKLKGFEVPADMLQRSLEYLRRVEEDYPHWYGAQTRQSLSAYALYVRQLMGDADAAKAARLLDEAGLEALSLEAAAWLWQVLDGQAPYSAQVEAIRRLINNRAVETAGAANFTTSYGDDAYVMLHSDRRTDGIILDTLIAADPESDLIPKVVNGLLAHRTRGRWDNTQENVFILLALDRYFNTFEAETPDFVANIWLGDTYAGSHEFVGRTTERHLTEIDMRYLTTAMPDAGEVQQLLLEKEGPGRLYYRLGLRYAPTDLDLDPLDMGFVVQRTYEAVDDPDDVSQDEDGVWHIKAGSRVRIRLTMVANNRRYHVALVDPLPAGLEIVNPALAVSGDIPEDPNDATRRYGWWWWGTWYEHQNMRDERAEAFTTLLWDGVYHYSYIARATTPGQFVVPPARAEEMYSPEVFGRSSSDRVIVE